MAVVSHYNRNQQYSVVALTDSADGIVERYAYSAYGESMILNASGALRPFATCKNRYQYTGREWDSELELYHYRARMYDPVAGRFVSRDPIGYEGSPWNLFEYVGSAPTHNTDPSGLFLGWGYGNYCGWSRRGQKGPPKDALDAACKRHDECQSTW